MFSLCLLKTCSLTGDLMIIGRDGLTHNMLNDIHNNWKTVEAVRIKCLGVPTVDMKNVCKQLEVTYPIVFSLSHFKILHISNFFGISNTTMRNYFTRFIESCSCPFVLFLMLVYI